MAQVQLLYVRLRDITSDEVVSGTDTDTAEKPLVLDF